ncbi:MAG: GTPase [Cyanobacteria bacterium QS_7_48_42]|nr:MAG: GTPase [Cyanobacteria bacterium QS_4_48_99]PSO85242.1 MAG: GTPase [Cyanobacteria bacterium QS_5_48_63]PSO86701.1 MAG: GTPase [Cyanobacteria bacterium QS_3_48_167]PSP01812.1 MAG: GTPase [Cyanobacteria bacterium QS_7_48_42]PSP06333.1 MAG: GTPase [Cyanobacteria bacterium SW_12_48_29]PSP13433.1 MAG: GTPase [Cyanobacteria bacterium SW_10_48_33]PSP16377.1 MAG: GTPase [Cyanobacteria bacterium SW_5_48_44]
MSKSRSQQETHFNQARASLRQALSWYGNVRRHGNQPPNVELQAAVRNELQTLQSAFEKLDQKVIRIAAFGLVSRGKSAVLNTLMEQKVLQTGPLHGVTQWPRAVRWSPPGGKVQVELIDTPGLDEVQGQARARMAREVAQQADLILFVTADDFTRTEYQALCELRQSQKPLLLVFNKIDLYPDKDRKAIYRQLQKLGTGSNGKSPKEVLSQNEIVMVAAEPTPLQVRVEQPDGQFTREWETPPPQVDELKEKILHILNREGQSLLALNALFQARDAEENIAKTTLRLRKNEAEDLIWKFAKYKALAVGLNPIAVVDVAGGAVADLILIRSLGRLYGLPMTSYEAGKLWKRILASSGGLLLGELGSSAILGFGKSGAAVASAWESPTAIASYAGAAVTQAGIAGYGAYAVGRVAQQYLEKGCSWGSLGPSTVIQEILNQMEPNAILYRLRQELKQQLN